MFPAKKSAILDRGGPKQVNEDHDHDERTTPFMMATTMPQALSDPSVPVPTTMYYYYGTDDNDDNHTTREHGAVCRICLEADEDPPQLIAPCLCKGSSQWVHRDCLDQWRTHEPNRAFATCTECQFPYRYERQPQHKDEGFLDRRTKFCLFVSRDVCVVTVAVPAIISGMGLLLYLVLHANDSWANWLCPVQGSAYDNDNNDDYNNNSSTEYFGCRHEYISYYLLGLVGTLICLGIFGCVFLCRNKCQIPDLSSSDENSNTTAARAYSASSGVPSSSYHQEGAQQQQQQQQEDHHYQRSQFYRHQRQRRSQAARRSNDNNAGCAQSDPCGDGCAMCCYPRYGYYPYYYRNGYYPGYYYGGGDPCCCGCCCDPGGSSHARAVGNNNNDTCECDCCPGGGHNSSDSNNCDEAGRILLILLLIFAVVMALIGLVVGIFVGVVIVQRIVQRHMFLLQKRRLVDHFRVADLSRPSPHGHVDLEQASPFLPDPLKVTTAATGDRDNDNGEFVKATAPPESQLMGMAPSAPPESEVLNAENERYLREWGLL